MINNRYKLLVVDIDGTLLGENGTISAQDKEAIARVSSAGIIVSLSTGRVLQACQRIINQLSLDGYHMFSDGALVTNPENSQEVYARPISQELVREIAEYTHEHEINLDFYSPTHYYTDRETWITDIRRRFFGIEPTITNLGKIWQQERIIKGTLVVSSAGERTKANAFRHHFRQRLSFSLTRTPAYPDVDFINVLARDVSKGKALQALTSYLELSPTDTIAIGDGENDLSLLATAGTGIAMGNAHQSLREIADYVTLDVEHSGVAAALDKFLL